MDAPPVQYVRTSDGYDIAYCVSGKGYPFVWAPVAFNHVQLLWSLPKQRRAFEAVAERYSLVQIDFRGQGMSTRGLPGPPSPEDYFRDLSAVVDHLGFERFVLLGAGGMAHLAALYAARYPSRVRALICNASHPWRTFANIDTPALARKDWDYFIHFVASVGRPSEDVELAQHLYRHAVTQADWMHFQEASRRIRSRKPDLRSVPALVMASRSTVRPGSEEMAKEFAAMLPDSRLALFDDIGGGMMVNSGIAPGMSLVFEFLAGLQPEPQAEATPQGLTGLSSRELEVLRLLAAGKTNPEIAEALVISSNTVAKHVTSILTKTGTANRTEAALYARDHALA